MLSVERLKVDRNLMLVVARGETRVTRLQIVDPAGLSVTVGVPARCLAVVPEMDSRFPSRAVLLTVCVTLLPAKILIREGGAESGVSVHYVLGWSGYLVVEKVVVFRPVYGHSEQKVPDIPRANSSICRPTSVIRWPIWAKENVGFLFDIPALSQRP